MDSTEAGIRSSGAPLEQVITSGAQGRYRKDRRPKYSKQKMIRLIAEAMSAREGFEGLPAFQVPFSDYRIQFGSISVSPDSWTVGLLDHERQVCDFGTDQKLLQYVTMYLEMCRCESEAMKFNTEDAFELSRAGKGEVLSEIESSSMVVQFDEIKAVRQLSDKGWAHHRLGFDIERMDWERVTREAPEMAELLNRLDRSDLLCRFFYECVTGYGNRKKSLWLYGARDSYKTSFVEAIGDPIFGKAFRVIPEGHFAEGKDRWLPAELLGKSLVAIDDVRGSFVQNACWKTLTGSSQMLVERKFGQPFDATIHSRFLMTSNYLPELDPSNHENAEAQATRLWVVRLSKPEVCLEGPARREWQARIQAQIPYLLGYGRDCYEDGTIGQDLSELARTHRCWEYLDAFTRDENGIIAGSALASWANIRGFTRGQDVAAIKAMLVESFGAVEVRTKAGKFLRGVRIK